MSGALLRLIRCTRAASAAEFSLVLPLMLLFLFGIIDVGRFMWEVNQAEKATQMGARFAVVTNPVSSGLVTADFAGGEIEEGELIPADALGALACTSSGCTCTGCAVSIDSTVDSTAFDALVARMQQFKPNIDAANVQVTYRGSGFGFAQSAAGPGGGGAAETMEISPLVTVSLTDVEFQPFTLLLFGGSIPLPSSATTLVAEDASGAVSN